MFELRPNYLKVLRCLRDGTPKTSAELSAETGIDYIEVVGAVSMLRRGSLLAQAGEKKYRITDKGRVLYDTTPGINVSQRAP